VPPNGGDVSGLHRLDRAILKVDVIARRQRRYWRPPRKRPPPSETTQPHEHFHLPFTWVRTGPERAVRVQLYGTAERNAAERATLSEGTLFMSGPHTIA